MFYSITPHISKHIIQGRYKFDINMKLDKMLSVPITKVTAMAAPTTATSVRVITVQIAHVDDPQLQAPASLDGTFSGRYLSAGGFCFIPNKLR